MRMLFVADLHYALKQFDWVIANAPLYDLVVIGGDLLDLSSALDLDVQIVVVEKYLARIGQKTPVLVSSGNHDGDSRSVDNESVCRWLLEAKAGQVFVDGDTVEIGGNLISICPWWDGPVSRAQLSAQLDGDAHRTKNRWIWIHHAPPDQSPTSWSGKNFFGDRYLVEAIKRHQPDLVLCGHVHNAPYYPEGSWIDRIGRTWALNPGRQIGASPAYLVIDLTQMTAARYDLESEVIRDLTVPVAATLPDAGAGS